MHTNQENGSRRLKRRGRAEPQRDAEREATEEKLTGKLVAGRWGKRGSEDGTAAAKSQQERGLTTDAHGAAEPQPKLNELNELNGLNRAEKICAGCENF